MSSRAPCPTTIFYSPKANPAPPVVRALANSGCGIDTCSAFDLVLAESTGVKPQATSYCSHALSEADLERHFRHVWRPFCC